MARHKMTTPGWSLMLLGLLVVPNLLISWLVLRSDLYSGSQKAWQIAAIWCFPAMGAWLCWYFLVDTVPTPHRTPNHTDFDMPLGMTLPSLQDCGDDGCAGGGDGGGGD